MGEADANGAARAGTVGTVAPVQLSSKTVSALGKIPSVVILIVALVMPTACVVLTALFFSERVDEDSITNIWIRETSSLYKDQMYQVEVAQSLGTTNAALVPSNFFVISRLRDSSDILRADVWKEIEARFSDAQNSTKVSVDGMEFGFQDVCYNPAVPYTLPCLRLTLLDCFAEGGYDFPETAAEWWRETLLGTTILTLKTAIVNQALASPPIGPCQTHCVLDGGHPDLAVLNPGAPVGTWPSDPACKACMDGFRASPGFAVTEDMLYYGALAALGPSLAALAPPLAPLIGTLTPADSAQWDFVVRNLVLGVTGAAGKTPYTCEKIQERFTCNAPVGGPRPQLQDAGGNYLSREEMRRVVRGTCTNWDEGAVIPAYNKYLFYGGVEPGLEAENYTSMVATASLFFLMQPRDIRDRVGTNPQRPGGNVNVTEEQAAKVLDLFKQGFEAAMSRGWDDDGQRMRHTAFVDDIGAGGSFRTAMSKMNKESESTTLVFYACMPFISALFFVQCFRNTPVESKTALAFVANIIVYLGVFAAFGITALVDYRINIVHYGILPFMLVGLGLDDVYIVLMSVDGVTGASAEERWLRAVLRVINPVMMTSAVNIIQFLVLWAVCDVGALYKVALTGFLACGIQCLNVTTSVMPLLLLDLRRAAAGRCDVLCCLKASAPSDAEKKTGCTLYELFYKRLLNSVVGKIIVILAALALVVVACVRLNDITVGLNLGDFFPPNTQPAAYSQDQADYFPTWPVVMNWGEIEYSDPDVQMRMASQFEKVQRSQYIVSGLPTTLVWTAALAQWGIPSAFAVPNSPCRPGNLLTGGDCGELHGCESTFAENRFGLLLSERSDNLGICYLGETLINSIAPGDARAGQFVNTTEYCPTFQWDSADFRRCFMNWTATQSYRAASPGIHLVDGGPQLPIKISYTLGNSVFYSIGTHTSQDYVNLIKETRTHVDDDDTIRAWMTGTAYLFWEQYVDIIEFTFIAGAWSVSFGALCSFLFLFIELSTQHKGIPCARRLAIALLSALLIAALSFVAILTVVGICGWFNIKFSVFTSASCVFSTGFVVEYAVHVIHYFVEATGDTPTKRSCATMRRLAWPTFIAFLSTMISMCMLPVINVRFMTVYFFGPLCVSCLVTYFLGVLVLPSLLGFASCFPTLPAAADTGGQAGGAKDVSDDSEEISC